MSFGLQNKAVFDRSLLLLLLLLVAYVALLMAMGNTLNGQRRVLFGLVFTWCAYISPKPCHFLKSWQLQEFCLSLLYLLSISSLFLIHTFNESALIPVSLSLFSAFGLTSGFRSIRKILIPILSFSFFLNPQYLVMGTPIVPAVTQWSAAVVHGILYYFGVPSVVKGSYLYSNFGAIEVAYLCSFMGLLPVSFAVVIAAIPSSTRSQLVQMLIWSFVCNIVFSLVRLTLLAISVENQFWFELLHDRLKLVFQVFIVFFTLIPFADIRKNFDMSLYFKRVSTAG
jgi:hypothetical protein